MPPRLFVLLSLFLGTTSAVSAQMSSFPQVPPSRSAPAYLPTQSGGCPCPPAPICPPPGQNLPGPSPSTPQYPNGTGEGNSQNPQGQGQGQQGQGQQQANNQSPFSQQNEAGGLASRGYDSSMFGDWVGAFYTRVETVPVTENQLVPVDTVVGSRQVVTLDPNGNKVITTVPIIQKVPVLQSVTSLQQVIVRLPLAARYNGVKLTENDSPRPQDRVFFGFNRFNSINFTQNGRIDPVDGQREMIGIEKTILDGRASIGMRIPFVQMLGDGTLDTKTVGDLMVLFKYALKNEATSVRSVGLVVSAPTGGGSSTLTDGEAAPHSTLLQPWAGFVEGFGRGYAQGVTAVIIPSDSRDPIVYSNSLSLGYWVLRNENARTGRPTGLVPVTEVHLNTPLTNRGGDALITIPDQLNLTNGAYFVLPKATIGLAASIPVTGPRPWRSEFVFNINYRY